jgi:hypothetical protein
VLYRSATVDRDSVFVVAQLECPAEATSLPLISGAVRNFSTKVPHFSGCFIGDAMDGNCI